MKHDLITHYRPAQAIITECGKHITSTTTFSKTITNTTCPECLAAFKSYEHEILTDQWDKRDGAIKVKATEFHNGYMHTTPANILIEYLIGHSVYDKGAPKRIVNVFQKTKSRQALTLIFEDNTQKTVYMPTALELKLTCQGKHTPPISKRPRPARPTINEIVNRNFWLAFVLTAFVSSLFGVWLAWVLR